MQYHLWYIAYFIGIIAGKGGWTFQVYPFGIKRREGSHSVLFCKNGTRLNF